MQDMTIKQIAELCQIDESTVRRWIAQASGKMPGLSVKMTEAQRTKKPARFTLTETLAIIRAGGRSTLADLLQKNTAQAYSQSSIPIGNTVRELIPAIAAAVTAAMAPLIRELRTPASPTRFSQTTLSLPAASPDGEYYTIKAYGSMHGVHVNNTNAVMLGREASRISRLRNIDIHKAHDEKWGEINSYHISVLKEVFTV